ncbi:MAG: glycoside hydrolase family 2 TIM barrel-domain containing protein [Mongoliitalea sp.]
MKTLKIAVLWGLIVCLPTLMAKGQTRSKESINSHWKFSKGDFEAEKIEKLAPDWPVIHLPHTWNDQDVLPDGQRGYYRGKGYYFKELQQKFDKENHNYYLHFEGANQTTTVFMNGKHVGEHIGGYSAFRFDITDHLEPEYNQLAIVVDNSHNPDIPPLSADFTFFGGIYRDVWLISTSKLHFDMDNYASDGVFIQTPEVSQDQAKLTIKGGIQSNIQNIQDISLGLVIKHPNNNIIHESQHPILLQGGRNSFDIKDIAISNPDLWAPDSPFLYSLEAKIYHQGELTDQLNIPFGIRFFHFDPKEGFFLNGQPMKLMGANRHQDFMGMGNALSDEQHWADMKAIKDMGANFVRLAHYPQDPAVLRAADRLGLMIWEETPLVNEVTASEEHDFNSEEMLKEMIRQHYNHPSVIIWGYMNEIYWAHRFIDSAIVDSQTRHTVQLAKKLEKITRQEDPYRYTAMALHNYPLYESSGLSEIPQIVSWNLYHGWYYDNFEDFGKFMDEQHALYPERIHFISEFGAGSDPRLHSTKPEKFDFTMEGHKRFLESYLKQLYERPYISGGAVWNLIDFSSERRIDTNPHLNNKGILTSDRTPKDVYYLFQAYLSDTPVLKIAETNWRHRSALSTDGKTAALPVQIYSNLPAAELIHNGQSLGEKTVTDHHVTWDVVFIEGENIFEAKSPHETIIKDRLEIHFTPVAESLKDAMQTELYVNFGSNHSFFDDKGKVNYIPSRVYDNRGWGHVGGKSLYIANKIGTKEDILTTNEFVPLYQTMQEGIEKFYADMPDGEYVVELWMVEPFPRSRRFVEGIESPKHPGGIRVFDISINGLTVIENLDLLKDFGYNYPVREKFVVNASNNSGIEISFTSKVGRPIISALSIKKL